MTNHVIEMKRNRYNDGWTTAPEELEIVVHGVLNRAFGLGQADRGRAVYQGPLIENLAFLFGLATVLSGWHYDAPPQITVNLGDTLEFLGRKFEVVTVGDGYNATLKELS